MKVNSRLVLLEIIFKCITQVRRYRPIFESAVPKLEFTTALIARRRWKKKGVEGWNGFNEVTSDLFIDQKI